MKYVIGSGWWCADTEVDSRATYFGDGVLREQHFHKLWYEAICKYSSPEKIIIVDSCSPIKPELNKDDARLEFVSLNVNAGHNTDHLGKFCGCVRAMQLGLEYTLKCDVDYYVYVEQDALIYGQGIIEHCISKMTKPYMFGTGAGTPLRSQQSLFIIHKDGILPFLNRLNQLKQTDNEICPEEKFHLVSSYGPIQLLAYISQRSKSSKLFDWLNWQFYKYLRNWQELPVGVGRVRPIDFGKPYFYFQHGSEEELNSYLAVSEISWQKKSPQVEE